MIKTLFPTLIFNAPVASTAKTNRLNKEIVREAYILKDLDDHGRDWSKSNYVGGYTSYSSLTDIHKTSPTFGELRKLIDKAVAQFSRSLEMDLQDGKLVMTNCWLNIMPAGTHHSGHVHPLSVISGTYYVQVPKGAGPLKFEDPRLPMMMHAPPKKDGVSIRNQQIAQVSPRAGQVILFESWLRHEVPASLARTDRISVSFNYEWV